MRIILASASRVRAGLLRQAGLEFDVKPPHVDEDEIKLSLRAEKAPPQQVAEALAELKARRVSDPGDQSFVIGCDQMLACGDDWFDKPTDLATARRQLLALRGRTHHLHAAVAVARGGGIVWRHRQSAALTMRSFSEAFLDAYLAQAGAAVLTSVGGYQLESLGVQLFERIEGDYFTILGLPLLPLLDFFRANNLMRT